MALELQRAGWSGARALVGGWNGYVDSGLPTEAKDALAPDHSS